MIGTSLLDVMRPQWDRQMRNRREPQLAAVQQDGDKPVFAPVGAADSWPVFLRPAQPAPQILRELLQRLLEPLQRVGLFLFFSVLLLLLNRVIVRFGGPRIGGGLWIHDHSPLG